MLGIQSCESCKLYIAEFLPFHVYLLIIEYLLSLGTCYVLVYHTAAKNMCRIYSGKTEQTSTSQVFNVFKQSFVYLGLTCS